MAPDETGHGVPYPASWEADVVMSNGRPVHIRPIRPDDGDRLRAFHESLSERTIYFRFFTAKTELSDEEIERFTHVDYDNRAAFVAVLRGNIVGVARYDRIDERDAEVAFVLRDELQGRGLGSILLEHLAAAARERGIRRFIAETLTNNSRMIATFTESGFKAKAHREDDVIAVEMDLEVTEDSRDVRMAREQRGEARSIERLLTPSSVAIVGVSRRESSIGRQLLRNLRDSGYTGEIIVVHPEAAEIDGFPCIQALADHGDVIDLAIVAVDAEKVDDVIQDAASAGVLGLVVVSGGFGDSGADGMARQQRLVDRCHAFGMRLIGPNALGIINTDPQAPLNASLVPRMPEPGSLGFFSQSGALGSSLLERMRLRGIGISSFVSAGNRADVSGNDLLQYWDRDQATSAVMLYLESIGNARKFARLVRRMSTTTPVLLVRTGGSGAALPTGHSALPTALSYTAFAQILIAAGLSVHDSVDDMLDTATILSTQPMPRALGAMVVGNSDAVSVLARNAADRFGLPIVAEPETFARASTPGRFAEAIERAAKDPNVGAVIVVHIPPIESADDAAVIAAIDEAARASGLCTVVVGPGLASGAHAIDGIPRFVDVEDAVRALASVVAIARRLSTDDPGLIAPEGYDWAGLDAALAERADTGLTVLRGTQALGLLRDAGITLALAPVHGHAMRIQMLLDPLFGPVMRAGLDDPIAARLDDATYRLAPIGSPQEAADALGQVRTIDLAAAAGRLPVACADLMHILSWVNHMCPNVVGIDCRGIRPSGPDSVSVAHLELTLSATPPEVDPDVRRL